MVSAYNYLWYFLCFSFLGWCVEVGFHAVKSGRFVNRGFASGPICPIYGTGVCLVGLTLRSIESGLVLFLASALVASAVELIVGFVMDKTFGSRWWDYSAERFNLFGYVCLKFSLAWGSLCMLAVRLLTPLDYLIEFLRNPLGYALSTLLILLVLLDLFASVVRVVRFNRHLELLESFAAEVSSALTVGSDLVGRGVYRGTVKAYSEYEKILARAAKLGMGIIDAFPTFRSKAYNRHVQLVRRRLENIKSRKSARSKNTTKKP